MHIALAADCGCVSQALRNYFDCPHNVFFSLSVRIKRPKFPERNHSKHSASPGSKILCREILTCDLPQVLVHIGGINRLTIATIVNVLKKFIPGNVLTALHNFGEPAITDFHRMVLATLTTKMETQC